MSSDFYFNKWKQVLKRLKNLLDLDLNYQERKEHDKSRCGAVHRLSSVLAGYIFVYNEAMECLHNNLQVQKTSYIEKVVKAIEDRILEIKHQLSKLECSNYEFLGNGLINQHLTPYDIEMTVYPLRIKRPEDVQILFEEAKNKVRLIEEEAKNAAEKESEPVVEKVRNWWEDDTEVVDEVKDSKDSDNGLIEKPISEETLKRRELVALIVAHEKCRQITQWVIQSKQKRDKWEKELSGNLKPQERIEIRENAAKIIQQVIRAYFEIKRRKALECKRDEVLGMRFCQNPIKPDPQKFKELKESLEKTKMNYEKEWKKFCEKTEATFLFRRKEEITEGYRDHVRDWFQKWYDEVMFFYDIPRDDQGGIAAILKAEIPSPFEWIENYTAYMEDKKSKKNKTALEIKFEKSKAKKEEKALKKEQMMKKKLEAALMKQIMKNPNAHPGFNYPASKKANIIREAIEHYHKDWDDLDFDETFDVKEKFSSNVDFDNICMQAKIHIAETVADDMRAELKLLKKALKADYETNENTMPEPIKEKNRRKKKEKKIKTVSTEHLQEKIESLIIQGVLKEYPKTGIEDFLGDFNLTGDDQRCNQKQAMPLGGETRHIWWEKCRQVSHGYSKILLVGPRGSGKTVLVHALATANDAVLFELDLKTLQDEDATPDLQSLINNVMTCSKALQPSVIYIRHIHRMYYRKVPPGETNMNFNAVKLQLTRKLFKKFHDSDKICIIGTCFDPWLTKSKLMLKPFPSIIMLPNTSYSVVLDILNSWVMSNHTVPKDFEVSSLAYVLQGYRFGYLKESLQNFLTAERIIKIAAHGLHPLDVYSFIIDNEAETKVDYAKYLKWYSDKTYWGKKEKKHMKNEQELKLLAQLYAEKAAKKKKAQTSSSHTIESSSHTIKSS